MFKDAANTLEEVKLTYLKLRPHFTAPYPLERDTRIAGEGIIMSDKFAKAGSEKTAIISDMRVVGLPIRLSMIWNATTFYGMNWIALPLW